MSITPSDMCSSTEESFFSLTRAITALCLATSTLIVPRTMSVPTLKIIAMDLRWAISGKRIEHEGSGKGAGEYPDQTIDMVTTEIVRKGRNQLGKLGLSTISRCHNAAILAMKISRNPAHERIDIPTESVHP
jgi:hypothetical protein